MLPPSSPLASYYPQTPSGSRHPLQYKPLNSSPLIDSPDSPKSSPMAAVQARRRSQYKSHTPTTPVASRRPSGSNARENTRIKPLFGLDVALRSGGTVEKSDPQKTFIRDRLKARCLERAVKARERAIRGRRYGGRSEPSSDDIEMDEDDEEEDEDIMQDELFRRIAANANRNQTHSYRISYAQEVGSSFDPDMEDVSSWEQELSGVGQAYKSDTHGASASLGVTSSPASGTISVVDEIPDNLDDDELDEYAEEYARLKALEDFADLGEEDLYWSDDEDLNPGSTSTIQARREELADASMDIS